ncbi:MAG: restriction endonuclease [Acidobacteriota bacterium]|nr:restriction endonuclease [Acidobacteriota bacterium]
MEEDKSIEYEKLVQDIYQALHKVEGLDTMNVFHNVKIEGRSGCKHQIDVYWEVEIVGELYRVAIECKNYKDKVEVGRVRDFFGVLHDIRNIKGILVTKIGYESGALKFADYYGISLKEVRFPNLEDWSGRLKDVVIDVNAYKADILKRSIIPDGRWLVEAGKIRPEDEYISFSLPGNFEDKTIVYNEAGEKITDFLQMRCELPCRWTEEQGLSHKYSFENGYIDTVEFGRMKISNIKFTYDVVAASVKGVVEGEEIAKAVIRDMKTGEIKLIDTDGNVRE